MRVRELSSFAQHGIFCAVVLSTALSTAQVPTAREGPATAPSTLPSRVTMVYTLGDDNHDKIAENPTVQQIKAAVASLDGDHVQAVYVNRDDKHGIQANWIGPNAILFQYGDGDDRHLYRSSKNYPPDMAVKLLMSFMSGKDDWRKMVEWEPEK